MEVRAASRVDGAAGSRWTAMVLLSIAELLGMSLWFGVSSVAPRIASDWRLSGAETVWLTLAVQLGFVGGTLISAVFNLPDVLGARRLFVISALLGSITNAALGAITTDYRTAVALRLLTGAFLAGVYPPAMKIMATWFRGGRGLALGVLVGALTLGKATPYLVNTFGSESWRTNVLLTSALAAAGGLVVLLLVRDGPYALPNQPFDITQFAAVFRNRGVRLANFGYFGHMWELYAMWAWAPVMLRASFADRTPSLAEAGSFVVIGSGAVGCVAAGWLGDRVGRTAVTSWAMGISGLCCLLIGFLFNAPPLLLLTVAAIWGAAVVADSAQFSACVTELGDPRYLGTALTLQMCIGFLITTLTIGLVPLAAEHLGWRYAFATLAPGPLLGIVAMMRLRGLPESVRIAQGKR